MSRILFALLCSIAINAQAAPLTHAKSFARTSTVQAEKPVPLPVLSKESAGFCQAGLYISNPNYDMMDMYVQQGADINAFCIRDARMSALYHSLSSGGYNNFQMADWLIQHGADINIAADVGDGLNVSLPMMVAALDTMGYVDLKSIDYLIQHNANFKSVDNKGRSALHWFRGWWIVGLPNSASGDISGRATTFVDRLIGQGININLQDKNGMTALMNAVLNTNQGCSPGAVRLLLSHGANPTLRNKQDKSALDFAMDRAAQAGQGSPCNEVVKILYNPQQISRSFSSKPGSVNNSTSGNSGQQGLANYVGTYGGTYSGLDEGVFQADIFQDGTATFHLHSNKSGGTTTHAGNVNNDGSVLFGKPGIGAVFVGHISREGILAGTWLAPDNDKGDFQGQKGVQVEVPGINAAQFLGSLFK